MDILPKNIAGMLYARIAAALAGEPSREAFAELRGAFDYAVSTLLQGDVRTFGTQYSRLVYLCSKYNASPQLTRVVLAFARRSSDFAQKTDGDTKELRAAGATLVFILNGFSGAEPPEILTESILEATVYEQGTKVSFTDRHRQIVSGVVMAVSPMKTEDARRYFVLDILCHSQEDMTEEQTVQVSVTESYAGGFFRSDLMRALELVRPFSWVNITDLEVGSAAGVLHTSPSSLLVLEPDYLVDVTDIAGCFGGEGANPYIFLLSKLSPDRDSEAMFKGTLINDLLDAYLADEHTDAQVVFRKALSKNLLKAARYGGQAVKRIWDSVLGEHGENIAAFARSLQGQRVSVEPSFISALYGIQGRLDVLTEYPDDTLLKNIYELKSGRAPSGTALWRSNQIQVACYDMLLNSVYGDDRRGTSALFYSSAGANPVRNFLSSLSDRAAIVALRNEIVSLVYRLAEGDYAPLDKLSPDLFGECPSYLEETLREFSSFYGRLSRVKKKYYRAFLSFSLREMMAAKTGAFSSPGKEGSSGGGYSSLWRDTDARKCDNFAMIGSLEFEWFDRREHLLHFAIRQPVEHTFRPGDVAVLYPHSGLQGDALRNQIIKGVVREVAPEHLAFSPRGAQVDMDFFGAFPRWAVEHDMMEKGYWAGIAGLFGFLSGKSVALGAAFGSLAPQVEDFDYPYDDQLTPNQNESVYAALRARDYFLLQGPPGTGKTSGALMGIVKNILSGTADNIVLLAFTNRAVQEIAEKLRKNGIRFLRLGHESAAGKDRTLSGEAENLKVNGLRDFLSSQRVVLATVSAFSSRMDDLQQVLRFDVAVVDEASQLTEVQLAGVLAAFRKFILIGDQKQLPAVTVQGGALAWVDDADLQAIGLSDLRGSLFERLWEYAEKKGYVGVRAMLDTHFRMHEDIAGLVNPFYGGMLRSGCERQRVGRPEPRLRFIPSEFERSFKRHAGEAARVAELLQEIKRRYGKRFSADTVGVVTPWRAQIAVIRGALDDAELLEKVTVDTVERFQGGEKEVMIVSMAVFDPSQMAMLESVDGQGSVDRKLNVVLSRAREELILLGYEPALLQSPFYARVLEAIRSKIGD